jgi:hypothetical protein
MAITPTNIGWNQVNKAVTKTTTSVIKTAKDLSVPKTPLDAALMVAPYGKIARTVGGITGKGARAITKVYRNMGK